MKKYFILLFLFINVLVFSQKKPDLTIGNLRVTGILKLSPYPAFLDSAEIFLKKDTLSITTKKPFVSFDKPIFTQGKKLITTSDTTNKWLPKTGTAVNSSLVQGKDTIWIKNQGGGALPYTKTLDSVLNWTLKIDPTLSLSIGDGSGYGLNIYNRSGSITGEISGSSKINTSYSSTVNCDTSVITMQAASAIEETNININPSGMFYGTHKTSSDPLWATDRQYVDSLVSAEGTTYLTTTGNGSGLTGITASQVGAATNTAIYDSLAFFRPIKIAYTTSLPLTKLITIVTGKTLTTNDTLTIASNPIEGAGFHLILYGDGSHQPVTSAFDVVIGNYDLTLGAFNLLTGAYIDGKNILSISNQ